MTCNVCGRYYSSPSLGGPGICSSCDCGIPPQNVGVMPEYLRYQPSPTSFNDNSSLSLRLSAVEAELKELTKLVKNALPKENIADESN